MESFEPQLSLSEDLTNCLEKNDDMKNDKLSVKNQENSIQISQNKNEKEYYLLEQSCRSIITSLRKGIKYFNMIF